jgi:putative flavoprotein involved in K+ transport
MITPETTWDVLVVGAGAAGVGVGAALKEAGVTRFALLERHEVGASFRRWPAEMRFITPSFASNAFGLPDLNAVTWDTSPAFSLGSEHPTGAAYADYLQMVARHYELPVESGVEAHRVQPLPDNAGFRVETNRGPLHSRFVIWAAGEFQYPHQAAFAGAEHCLHTSQIPRWDTVRGDEIVIIGGYESGIDAAVNLVRPGRAVRVLDALAPWQSDDPDPSFALSPYTMERLLRVETGLELIEAEVARVERVGEGYSVCATPLLATGFVGSLTLVEALFDWHEEGGFALLTGDDESTRTPGLFLVGPAVRHGNAIFCFIYKFRQRFALVARAIAERLGLETADFVARARARTMYLDDLSCCELECAC